MNAADRKTILDRIAKLLRLADRSRNDSEGEALNAMEAAMRLMREYNLSHADVAAADGETGSNPYGWEFQQKTTVEIDGAVAFWIKNLSTICAMLTQTRCIAWRRKKTDSNVLGFVGEAGDVEIAALLFNYLYDFVLRGRERALLVNREAHAEQFRRACKWCNGAGCLICLSQTKQEIEALAKANTPENATLVKNSYAEGFCVAVQFRATRIADDRASSASVSEERALAVAGAKKSEWLVNALAVAFPGVATTNFANNRKRASVGAFFAGLADGERVDIATANRLAVPT